MATIIIQNCVGNTLRQKLSAQFLEWCKFDQQFETYKENPEIFLSAYTFYIIHPPKGSVGVTEAFLPDAKKMCLIGIELNISESINAKYYKFLGEVLEKENDPTKALLFLKRAKDFFVIHADIFVYEMEEIAQLELMIYCKISNTLEDLNPNSHELFDIERKIFNLHEELALYRSRTE